MRRNEGLPSKYLTKEDFQKPVLCQIASVVMEEIEGDGGKKKKPVLFVMGPSDPKLDVLRGIILNGTNWDAISEIRGEDPNETDTDDWEGTQIVLFNDPKVMFGGKKIGGIRIRPPAHRPSAARTTRPVEPEPPPVEDDHRPATDDELAESAF
jgi:hypothetical protein